VRVKVVTVAEFLPSWPFFFARTQEARMKDHVAFCRLSEQLDQKLSNLSEQTGWTRSEVLRALIASVNVEDIPPTWRGEEAAMVREISR
jgi:hypothetical protein